MSQKTLYGGETRKAIENFPISGEPVPISVIHWLARIKGAAAAVNAELGLLRPALARRIEKAAAAVAAGEHDDQFPIDVFQTGSGHVVEHERQRGHRGARRRGRAPQRPRQPRAVLQRRLPVGRAPRRARAGDSASCCRRSPRSSAR